MSEWYPYVAEVNEKVAELERRVAELERIIGSLPFNRQPRTEQEYQDEQERGASDQAEGIGE